jgi:hypothetical protein
MIVGLVGPAAMIADATQWLERFQGILKNDGKQPFSCPHFPGFNSGRPFHCQLLFGDPWREAFRSSDLDDALGPANFFERIKRVVKLYARGIEILRGRDPRPNVVMCCIPQNVIEQCTVRVSKVGEVKRLKVGQQERLALKQASHGQTFLFPEMDPTIGIEDDLEGHENLRRGIKAEAMAFDTPTQLVWPRTLRLVDGEVLPGEAPTQDIATRAWNLAVALYHKAGAPPWRLALAEPGVCYVGVSFYREIRSQNPCLRTSLAQTFTSAGDGYVLRGKSFEWIEDARGRSPHLDAGSAAALMHDVLNLYQRQNKGSLPTRIVVHKSSKYWQEELAGFSEACSTVASRDFVAFGSRGIQFYRSGDYPPLRGTYIKFSDKNALLYTTGYIPYLRTYPGARAPKPLEIVEHEGDSPWDTVLLEVLALTKMNWNTAYYSCAEPITLAFSHRVGQILAELPEKAEARPEYRFYM